MTLPKNGIECPVHHNEHYRCQRCGKCNICEHTLNDIWWRCHDDIEVRGDQTGRIIATRPAQGTSHHPYKKRKIEDIGT